MYTAQVHSQMNVITCYFQKCIVSNLFLLNIAHLRNFGTLNIFNLHIDILHNIYQRHS